jgi:enoyl-CoA hydratase
MPSDVEQGAGLDVACADGVLRLTMDRPERLNAMTPQMSDRLAAELEAAAARDHVRVVLLAGRGGAFSSGADLSGRDAHQSFDVTSLDRANRIIRAIVGLDKPCVAAVGGVAAGVGCSVAVACDLVVAAQSATFLLAFSRIGLMPDGGATATVAASVGRARAMRMALLAEPLTAAEAHAAGLVSHLVPDQDLAPTVEQLVARLAGGPPLAHAATKKAVNAATLDRLPEALERERTGQTILLRTGDVAEGMQAFSEKRRPRFTGG